MNANNTGRNILVIFVSIVLLAGAFSGGLIIGWLIPSTSSLETITPPTQVPSVETIEPTVPTVPAVPTAPAEDFDTLFKPFWEAWQIVHEQYVDQPVDDLLLMRGAIRGMLESLGDKHTGYMTPQDFQQATTPLEGSYTGIGAWVDTSGTLLTIISPMPDSPAEKAGLKPGDEIIAIDGVDVTKTDPSVVLQSVLGPEGTTVVMKIQRQEPEEILELSIIREVITIASIESRMLESNIGYVALYSFGESTSRDLDAALRELLAEDPVGLILDLREDSGGYVDTAMEVASQFIPSGVIMIERLGTGEEVPFEAIPGGLATEIPLVVLVNGGSASASEIVAGAIQDLGRGKIVGTTTYGKGSVQIWVPLEDEQGAVKVTIARWLTPNGRLIHETGLTPDYVVEITEEDIDANRDPQLDKAVELLLENEG